MARIGAWLKKRLAGSSANSEASKQSQPANPPPCRLPYLPPARPRPLTPTSASPTAQLQPQLPSCPLFAKVPGDVRGMILETAFGGHTLDMDLVFDYPLLPPPPLDCTQEHRTHARIYPQRGEPSGDKVWRWGGSICHRNSPNLAAGPEALRYRWFGPWNDACMKGYSFAACCEVREGSWPENSQIGVMGFLRSCRQAYVEGIHVLYSASCISITSEPLLLHFPRLLLPQRLAAMTSLELVVKQHYELRRDGRMDTGLDHLELILDNIAKHCLHLRSLCLSFTVSTFDVHVLDSTLPTLDAFYRSMQLRDMRVELPRTIYETFEAARSVEDHPLEPQLTARWGQAKWRCLDGEEPEVQYRAIGNYPNPPLKILAPGHWHERVPSSGYWFSEGEEGPGRVKLQG